MADLVCPVCNKTFSGPSRKGNYTRHLAKHEREGAPVVKVVPDDAEHVIDVDPTATPRNAAPETDSPYDAETPPNPTPQRTSLRQRLRVRGRGLGGRTAAPARSTGERAPRQRRIGGKRVSLDEDISDVYAALGRRLERTPHYPTGRMLQFTSLAAGTIIDDAVAGTLPDRMVLQLLARGRDKWEPALVIVALPLITFRITSTQAQLEAARVAPFEDPAERAQAIGRINGQLEMLTEAFDWLAEMGLPLLAPGVEKARAKEAKRREAMAQAFPELGLLGEDVSAADALRSMLFTPPAYDGGQDGDSDGHGESVSRPFGAEQEGAVA